MKPFRGSFEGSFSSFRCSCRGSFRGSFEATFNQRPAHGIQHPRIYWCRGLSPGGGAWSLKFRNPEKEGFGGSRYTLNPKHLSEFPLSKRGSSSSTAVAQGLA